MELQALDIAGVRRWVVERFFAWINRNRRLAKDVEAPLKSAAAFLYGAAVLAYHRLADIQNMAFSPFEPLVLETFKGSGA